MPKCNQCDHISANPESLITYNRDYHVAVMYYGEGLTPISRNEKGFTCPICHKNYTVTRSFFTHLKQHGLNASIIKKRKFNELTSSSNELDSDDEYHVGK